MATGELAARASAAALPQLTAAVAAGVVHTVTWRDIDITATLLPPLVAVTLRRGRWTSVLAPPRFTESLHHDRFTLDLEPDRFTTTLEAQ